MDPSDLTYDELAQIVGKKWTDNYVQHINRVIAESYFDSDKKSQPVKKEEPAESPDPDKDYEIVPTSYKQLSNLQQFSQFNNNSNATQSSALDAKPQESISQHKPV